MRLQYYNLPEFYELITGKIPVASLEKTWFLDNISAGKKIFFRIFKRFEDIVVSILLGLVTLPFTIILAVLIKFTSPGSLFYTQIRTGQGGRKFTAIKFRSMVQNAESSGQAVWASKNDSRVTSLGRFMRKTRLDEIPQVYNILKGEMGLVGPRAYYPFELDEQQQKYPNTKEFVKVILSAKPGLTGIWQVSGRSNINFDKRVEMDADYVNKRSILYDIYLILKTVPAVLLARGAV